MLRRIRKSGAYGVAILAVAVAALARLAVYPNVADRSPFLFTFAFAVAIAALFGGYRAGIVATVLSLLAGDYFFIEPRYSLLVHETLRDRMMLLVFGILGVSLSLVIESLNRARDRVRSSVESLKAANAQLKTKQSELERANERFRMATEAANEAIWELNLPANTASWTDLYAKNFGRSAADGEIDWWFDHIHPEDRTRVRDSFFATLKSSANSWSSQYRMLRANGNWADVQDRASIARNGNGQAVRAIGAIQDVTETKLAQKQLQLRTDELARSNEDLQRFAFAVSHDLKAPLQTIGQHCQTLSHSDLSEDAAAAVRLTSQSIDRMRRIIDDLLEFARAGHHPSSTTFTDSDAMLSLALQHLQCKIVSTRAVVHREILPLVMANDTGLLRVWQNLIGNALTYCEQQPCVRIQAQPQGDEWIFSVADNGIGIPAEYHQRIFGFLERLHSRDKYPGTGIGLALAKRIVESCGGRMWVESEVGNGSTFFFSLPAADSDLRRHLTAGSS